MSAHTVLSYSYDLNQWHEFSLEAFGEHFDPLKVEVNDLRLWVSYLSSKNIQPRSITRKIQTLRAFYKYLMRKGKIDYNPAEDLSPVRASHTLPKVIKSEEIKKVIDRSYDHSDFEQVRNHLIITMLYSTGMRASELTGLLDVNVFTDRGELKVLGKRNKERIIPFGHELKVMIEAYRRIRPESTAPQLFVREDGRPLSYEILRRIVKTDLSSCTQAPKRTPHVLRHTFATDMLNNGAEITAVQQLLGHASLATTQIYTHLSYKELQKNYQLAHPRAQKKG